MKWPNELIESLKGSSCAVFVGAGLSQGAGLPSWKKMLTELITEAKGIPGVTPQRLAEYKAMMQDRSKYLPLASLLRRDLAKRFDDYVTRRFASPVLHPTEAHRLIMQLPARVFMTTNYDNLLERAYSEVFSGKKVINALTYKQVGQLASCLHRKEIFLLKAHGDVTTEPEGVVLAERDYRELVHTQPGYQSFLQTVFTTNNMLFLGASLDDLDLRLLLGFLFTAYHGKTPGHYALMHESAKNNAEASALFHDYNINVLPFKGPDIGAGILAALRSLNKAL